MRHVSAEPTPDEHTPGEIIKARREKLGLTQKGLAATTGIDRSAINKIERDREYLGEDRAAKIAAALDLPIEPLLRAKRVQLSLAQEVRALSEQALGAGDALARIEMKVDLALVALGAAVEPGQAGAESFPPD